MSYLESLRNEMDACQRAGKTSRVNAISDEIDRIEGAAEKRKADDAKGDTPPKSRRAPRKSTT